MKLNNELREIGYQVIKNVDRVAGQVGRCDNTGKDQNPAPAEVFVSSQGGSSLGIPTQHSSQYDEILQGL